MAFQPCTVCHVGFKGGAATLFPALVKGTERYSVKQKVCPDDSAKFRDLADRKLTLVSVGEKFQDCGELLVCSNCGGNISAAWTFFLNFYPKGEEDRQYWGKVCGDCILAVAEDWGIPL